MPTRRTLDLYTGKKTAFFPGNKAVACTAWAAAVLGAGGAGRASGGRLYAASPATGRLRTSHNLGSEIINPVEVKMKNHAQIISNYEYDSN